MIRTEYEYDTVRIQEPMTDHAEEKLEDVLNEMGSSGWQFVGSMSSGGDKVTLMFERPVSDIKESRGDEV